MALRTPLSVTPHLYMGDSTGRPLDNGVVYFGEQDKDPEFYPITLYSDDELTTPLMQPVHTKGGYLYDKGDMVEPHAKEIIYSVKVLDSYGRKVFYKGAMMRNSWNDDVIEQINTAIIESQAEAQVIFDNAATDVKNKAIAIVNDAINNTAVEGGVLADTFVTVTPNAVGSIARNQRDKNGDTVSVKDFGAKGDGVTDDTAALQAFFAYIGSNNVGTAYCSGTYRVSDEIVVGSATKHIIGNLTLRAVAPIDTMLHFKCGQDFKWIGSVFVYGQGSVSYASRTCRIGIRIGGSVSSSRNVFTSLNAFYFNQVGISCNNLTTLTNLGDCRAAYIGSGARNSGYSLLSDYTVVENLGTSLSTSQSTNITVTTLPPEVMETRLYLKIDGKIYHVNSVNRDTKTINVFPWLDLTKTSGELTYFFGAGVLHFGADAGILSISKVDATACSIGMLSGSLYPGIVDCLVTQNCGAGLMISTREAAACVGGQINGLYCESNDYDIIRSTRADLSMLIASSYALNLNKVQHPYAPRSTSNYLDRGSLAGVTIIDKGQVYSAEGLGLNRVLNSPEINITSGDRTATEIFLNSGTITVKEPVQALYDNFNWHSKTCYIFGDGVNQSPTGTIKLVAPDGYTINNAPDFSLSGFTGMALVVLSVRMGSKDILVSCSTLKPSVVESSIAQTTLTVEPTTQTKVNVPFTGGRLGDYIQVAYTKPLQGVRVWAEVVATDSADIYFRNDTTAPITLAAGTIKIIKS